MHAREREKGVGGQEGKKRRQRMANTSVVVVPHQKPQPRLCLPLVCVWRVWQVWGVCGRRGDQWQPPLWHSGCCGVCVMGLSGGGGSGKACQTNNTPWCVWWWMWRVWWQARRVGGVAWQPHSAHTPTTNHHHGAHHQSLCVCVCGTRGVVVVTTTPKQPGKRHACACAVCVMAHESRWMSTRTPTSVCGGCVGSEATSE